MRKAFEDYGIFSIVNGRSVCPECSHERKKKNVKCLAVDEQEGVWHCHHCGWSGCLEVKTLKKEYRKPDFKPQKLNNKAEEWFLKRGISQAVLDRNQISYTQHWMPQEESEVSCIAFPYFRNGEVINCKYRDGKKNFCMEKGAERILYGLDDIADTTIIVEGEIDKLSLEVVGFKNVVSVPDGAPSPKTKNYASKFTFLESDREKIESVSHWIIAVDADEPGQRLEEELARRLGRDKCSRVKWPDVKDANECLLKKGAKILKEVIESSTPFPINGVFDIQDISDKLIYFYDHGYEKGKATGIEELDELYTVREGEFTVVTGIPGHGKSNLIDNVMVNMAKLHGWNFAMYTPENHPMEDHAMRLIEKNLMKSHKPFVHDRMTLDDLEKGKSWAQDHFSWIYPDDDDGHSLDSILSKARSLVYQKGIKGLLIDPWNEIEHETNGQAMTHYISECLTKIKKFARKNGVHVWLVAHPTKMPKEQDGSYKCPTPYDIADSANFRNKADCCLAVHRSDFDSPLVEIHVQKVKFRQIGKTGLVAVKFNNLLGTYSNLNKQEYDEVYR